jgi:hypothetical protein
MGEGAEREVADGAKRSAIMREVNDRIRELVGLHRPDEVWEFHCECGSPGCVQFVSLRLADYDARRRTPLALRILSAQHAPLPSDSPASDPLTPTRGTRSAARTARPFHPRVVRTRRRHDLERLISPPESLPRYVRSASSVDSPRESLSEPEGSTAP